MTKSKILLLLVICLVINSFWLQAQKESYELAACIEQAVQHYPMSKSLELMDKSNQFTLDNLSKSYLPQMSILGQASYQSDVVTLPDLPVAVPTLPKDQYKVYLDVKQLVYDGGVVSKQKDIASNQHAIDKQDIEIELNALKHRIIQLYFGILLLDEQAKQLDLVSDELASTLKKVQAGIEYGILLKSNEDHLRAEQIRLDQKKIELGTLRASFLSMLSLFMMQEIPSDAIFERPDSIELNRKNNRPELIKFELLETKLAVQNQMVKAINRPKINLFLQAGFGRPALNFFETQLDPYYITGLQLQIPLSSYYTQSKKLSILQIQSQQIALQRDRFLLNNRIELEQEKTKLSQYEQFLETDNQLIELRSRIKQTAAEQLQQGVITSDALLKEILAESDAKLSKSLHEIQLLFAQYNYQFINGN